MKQYKKNIKIKRKKRENMIKIIITFFTIGIIIFIILETKKEKEKNEQTLGTFSIINVEIDTAQIKTDVEIVKKKSEINSKVTDWNLILVNKENEISEDYEFELNTIDYENKVDSRIVEALTKMLGDAKKEGLDPFICSAYRTNKLQTRLFNNKVNQYKSQGYEIKEAEEKASYWVTLPRTSEHEIGLAVDIVSKKYQTLDESQEKTALQKWLMEHCTDYGFILRYPTEKKEITKINYEPWHYRYVGIEDAKFMKKKDFCLEEYIDFLKQY